MAHAMAYCRVSSLGQNLALQRDSISRAAAGRGDEIVEWFEEKKSGKSLRRPVLDEVRKASREGRIPKLYVYRLDRLSRSGIRDTFEVVEEFRLHGTQLVSVSDGFSLEGPAGEIVLAVLSWAARYERISINERIAAARTRIKAEGGHWGRPSIVTPEAKAEIDRLRTKGASLREIARNTGISKSAVERFLRESGSMRSVVQQ